MAESLPDQNDYVGQTSGNESRREQWVGLASASVETDPPFVPDGAGTCERGCCEWDDEGKVLRYTPHPIGRCWWCNDLIFRQEDAQFDERGMVYDSDKCMAKAREYERD